MASKMKTVREESREALTKAIQGNQHDKLEYLWRRFNSFMGIKIMLEGEYEHDEAALVRRIEHQMARLMKMRIKH